MSEEMNSTSESVNSTIEKNSVVTFHYRMCQVDDSGNKLDWLEASFDDSPVAYLHGHGNIIRGVEEALLGKAEGEEINISVAPKDAYGERQDVPLRRVPIKHIYGSSKNKKYRVGDVVTVETDQGRRNVTVVKPGKFNVDVDLNHPFAGKTLYYEIKILGVRPASDEELAHGHAHGPGGHHH